MHSAQVSEFYDPRSQWLTRTLGVSDETRTRNSLLGGQELYHWATLTYILVGFSLKLSHHRLSIYIFDTITLWQFPPTVQFSASIVILCEVSRESLTSFRCDLTSGATEGTRTPTQINAADFKSAVSTCYTTVANMYGVHDGSRTHTLFRAQAPQACLSTNSNTRT